MELKTGQIVRHKGERKVIRRTYRNSYREFVIEFVDRTTCINLKDLELDGRK